MKDILKECEGCATYDQCLINKDPNPFIILCPCRRCIVKMVCNHSCEEYDINNDSFLEVKWSKRNQEKEKLNEESM